MRGQRNVEKIQGLIQGGAEIAGTAIGGALGFLSRSPEMAAVGAAFGFGVSATLKYIGNDICERVLSPREKVRIGGALAITADLISQRIDNGERIRDDGFFDVSNGDRSDGDEILESILLKCQREPEEKKIPYLGRLMASIAFDSSLNVELAHQIIKAAESLTYRQLCILKIAAINDKLNLKNGDYRNQDRYSWSLLQILYECWDVYNRGYISFGESLALGVADANPKSMKVEGMGAMIYSTMQLRLIPNEDILPTIELLK